MSSPNHPGLLTPPISDPIQESYYAVNCNYKTGVYSYMDSNEIKIESEDGSPIVDIILIDSDLGEDNLKYEENEKDFEVVNNEAEVYHSEKENSSNLEIIQVDDSQDLEEESLDAAPTLASLSNFAENCFLKKIEPFSEGKKMRILKNMLRLSTEEFIRIYVHQKKIPVVNLISILDVRIPQAFLRYKEADLIPFLRALINQSTRSRPKLFDYNSIDDCVDLIKHSNKILVVTGAGVSVSCGIPDFRSENGIYSRLKEFNLEDPQQMFCFDHFQADPDCFYSFAKEIYPSNFKPSPSHQFIKLLEDRGKLLRNYTQNIDTLETVAGIKNVIQCHGSFATATCLRCNHSFPGTHIERDIFRKRVPLCSFCDHLDLDDDYINIPPIIKPDIVFFGEGLPKEYDASLSKDYSEVDLLIVMGTSLKVRPVSEIPTFLPSNVPSIIINRTPNTSIDFDIQLLGYSDSVVTELCNRLGWALPNQDFVPKPRSEPDENWNSFYKPPHWHLFSGSQLTEVMASTPSPKSMSSDYEVDDSNSLPDILPDNSPTSKRNSPPVLPTPTISSRESFEVSPRKKSRRSIPAVEFPSECGSFSSRKRKISAPPYLNSSGSLFPRRKIKREAASSPDVFIDVDSSPSYRQTYD